MKTIIILTEDRMEKFQIRKGGRIFFDRINERKTFLAIVFD